MLDPRPHGKEGARHVITVGKIVLGDDRRRLLVVHVGVRVGLFEFTQRLDAVIRNDDEIRVLVDVLQNRAQYFVELDVLVRKRIRPDGVDLRVVTHVEGSNGI